MDRRTDLLCVGRYRIYLNLSDRKLEVTPKEDQRKPMWRLIVHTSKPVHCKIQLLNLGHRQLVTAGVLVIVATTC